jgi:hypothetical protein
VPFHAQLDLKDIMALRSIPPLVIATLLLSSGAFAQDTTQDPQDPPGRVGRLSVVDGIVQQRTADDPNWSQATLNFPVSNGFALAAQPDGRAEIEVGTFVVRLGRNSEVDVTNLDDKDAVLTLAQGEINLHIRSLAADEHLQIVTPRGIVDVLQPGKYHFEAGTTFDPTEAEVFDGAAQIEHAGAPIDVQTGQLAYITDDGRGSSRVTLALAFRDPLDQWADARDTPRQLPPQPAGTVAGPGPYSIPGAEDLARYGSYTSDPEYGPVWYPNDVPVGWAPYSYGHWAWVSPWGWTWIDDAAWGFAPFHYGRWIHDPRGWGWVPGVYAGPPVFAPALVVFVGTPALGVMLADRRSAVAWFPLGPREIFVPPYRSSVAYVRIVNRDNVTNINEIDITRVRDTVVINGGTAPGNFVNRRAAIVVPAQAFAHSDAVHRAIVPPPAALAAAPIAPAPAAAPARPFASAAFPHAGTTGTHSAPIPALRQPIEPVVVAPREQDRRATPANPRPVVLPTAPQPPYAQPAAVTPRPEPHPQPAPHPAPVTAAPRPQPQPQPAPHPAPVTAAPHPQPQPQAAPHPTPAATAPKQPPAKGTDADKDKKEQ